MFARIIRFLLLGLVIIPVYSRAQDLSFDDIKISWKDFKQRDDLPVRYFDTKINTKTFYTTQSRYENGEITLTVNLEIHMDKDNSWVKKQFMKSSDPEVKTRLLNHEKLHMIISLIHFRELYQNLSRTEFTNQYKSQLDSFIRIYNESTDRLNNQYDEETNHMKIQDKQEEWEKNILARFNKVYADDKRIVTEYRIQVKINSR